MHNTTLCLFDFPKFVYIVQMIRQNAKPIFYLGNSIYFLAVGGVTPKISKIYDQS